MTPRIDIHRLFDEVLAEIEPDGWHGTLLDGHAIDAAIFAIKSSGISSRFRVNDLGHIFSNTQTMLNLPRNRRALEVIWAAIERQEGAP